MRHPRSILRARVALVEFAHQDQAAVALAISFLATLYPSLAAQSFHPEVIRCHPEPVRFPQGKLRERSFSFPNAEILREVYPERNAGILRGVYPESNEKDPSLRSG